MRGDKSCMHPVVLFGFEKCNFSSSHGKFTTVLLVHKRLNLQKSVCMQVCRNHMEENCYCDNNKKKSVVTSFAHPMVTQ